MTTFTLEIIMPAGRYVMAGLSLSALAQQIERADENGINVIWIKAYPDKTLVVIPKPKGDK